MSILDYVAGILWRAEEIRSRLRHLIAGQVRVEKLLRQLTDQGELMSVTLQDFNDRLQTLLGTNATLGEIVTRLANDTANIAADIQRLKDQIGTGEAGLSPADAASLLSGLDDVNTKLGATAAALSGASDALAAAAAVVPEREDQPPSS